jgi:exonuclease III
VHVIEIASWNVTSICARAEHVKTWLDAKKPDVLLLQELKETEFPSASFRELGYDPASVTHKTYNGIALLRSLRLFWRMHNAHPFRVDRRDYDCAKVKVYDPSVWV